MPHVLSSLYSTADVHSYNSVLAMHRVQGTIQQGGPCGHISAFEYSPTSHGVGP